MSDSIWTRQRQLKERENLLLEVLRENLKRVTRHLDNDNWGDATHAANIIMITSIKMEGIERELENVNELVDGWERISKGMELLEGKS